jgi:hypothetical protein
MQTQQNCRRSADRRGTIVSSLISGRKDKYNQHRVAETKCLLVAWRSPVPALVAQPHVDRCNAQRPLAPWCPCHRAPTFRSPGIKFLIDLRDEARGERFAICYRPHHGNREGLAFLSVSMRRTQTRPSSWRRLMIFRPSVVFAKDRQPCIIFLQFGPSLNSSAVYFPSAIWRRYGSRNFPKFAKRITRRWIAPDDLHSSEMVTCPMLSRPIAWAAAGDRSISLPRTHGPRSLMRTVTHPL